MTGSRKMTQVFTTLLDLSIYLTIDEENRRTGREAETLCGDSKCKEQNGGRVTERGSCIIPIHGFQRAMGFLHLVGLYLRWSGSGRTRVRTTGVIWIRTEVLILLFRHFLPFS